MLTVYIAMPYGDHNSLEIRESNTQAAMLVWQELADIVGVFPFCPHLSHWLSRQKQRPRNEWLFQSLHWVSRCDCVLAIADEPTQGMRLEIHEARKLGMPVFRSIAELKAAYESG